MIKNNIFFYQMAEDLNFCWLISRNLSLYYFASVFLVFFVIAEGAGLSAQASDCVSSERNQMVYDLKNSISYFEDIAANSSFEVISNTSEGSWNILRGDIPSFGFSSSAYWLRFDICQPPPGGERVILEIEYPLLDSIDLFGIQDEVLVYQVHSGDTVPFSQRLVDDRNFLFYLPDLAQSPMRVYIRVHTESAVQVPLNLYTLTGFSDYRQKALLLQGIYFGIILAMILYNSFLFLSLRELPYLYYVCFTISYFSFQAVLQGFFQQYILGSVWWQNHALLIFGFIAIAFANVFAKAFLQLQQKKPVLSFMLSGIAWISFLAAALASMLPYVHMVKLMLALSIVSSLLIMFAGLALWMVGHLPARIFTLAWLPLLGSFVLASLNKFALLPRSFWTENIMQIGGVLEVILLSIALGVRINEEKQQRILMEQRLTSSLEEEVKERTLSLNHALAQLEAANSVLDKMSLTDSLTELANRRAFDVQFDTEFKDACRTESPLSLLLLDIDHFKSVNDTHGHQAGDQVLQAVAKTLRSVATRPRDKAYRYGGEEFAIVLNNTNLNGSLIVAEKMRKLVKQLQFTFDSGLCTVTISAGVCVFVPTDSGASHAPELKELIKEADKQLYLAKENGRDRVEASTVNSMCVS